MTTTTQTKHVIDCDAAPFIPEGWKVRPKDQLPNVVTGKFEWDPAKVNLYLSPNQQNGKSIGGYKLRKKLANEPVLNANVLDYLLAHPELIPEEWKQDEQGRTRLIFFWGTQYPSSGGYLFVRYLFWRGGRWLWSYSWLDLGWNDLSPAAVLNA